MMNRGHAFSLVELSIVLVILGLLTGGILAGQSLIRASELRSVSTEQSRWITAMSTFRDKYFALPGDMTNAQSFWGIAAVCPGLSGTAGAGVCNGDGNGLIFAQAVTSNEPFGAWEQLANAGLVEGSYTGNTSNAATPSNRAPIWGTNAPGSKLAPAGWTIHSAGTWTFTDTLYYEGNYDNMLAFGLATGNGFTAALKPEEAWNIDTKMDDGKPATGRVRTREVDGGVCTDLAASAAVSLSASVYLLSNSAVACSLLFTSGT